VREGADPRTAVETGRSSGNGAPRAVGIDFVLGASLVASLFGWGLLAVLERRTSRARTIWTAVAIVVVLVSLSLPLSTGITMSSRAALDLISCQRAAKTVWMARRLALGVGEAEIDSRPPRQRQGGVRQPVGDCIQSAGRPSP
jgi:Family of unknown function (DUF6069)